MDQISDSQNMPEAGKDQNRSERIREAKRILQGSIRLDHLVRTQLNWASTSWMAAHLLAGLQSPFVHLIICHLMASLTSAEQLICVSLNCLLGSRLRYTSNSLSASDLLTFLAD